MRSPLFIATLILSGAAHAAAETCVVFDEDHNVVVRGRVVQSKELNGEEGKPYKFTAVVLDSAICFKGTPDERLRFVAAHPVPIRWLGHYVSASGKMTASGDGWYLSVRQIGDVKVGQKSTIALPSVVQTEIKNSCDERPVLKAGFVTEKDVNGDGAMDYVLDYAKLECGGGTSNCGSAGCLTRVFASLSDGTYVKVLDENVRGINFRKIKGRSAMVLDLHGSACGRTGAASCNMVLFWNGMTFSAAN